MQEKRRDGMQKRENYLYVGIDLHKESHTAVLVNCWNEKLDVITIENKPSEFIKLARKVDKTATKLGLDPIYGLENAYGYGRSLAVWLIEKGYIVKDVNPSLAYVLFPTLFCSDILELNCIENFQLRPWDSVPNPGIYRFSSPKREKQP